MPYPILVGGCLFWNCASVIEIIIVLVNQIVVSYGISFKKIVNLTNHA